MPRVLFSGPAAARLRRGYGPCLALLVSCYAAAAMAQDAPAREQVDSVRSQISATQAGIKTADEEIEQAQAQLRRYETAAGRARVALAEVNRDITGQQQELARLNVELERLEGELHRERQGLAEQLRAAHRRGRYDYFKLLLNQEDPAAVGRMLIYHQYFSAARLGRIKAVRRRADELRVLQDEQNRKTVELLALRARQQDKLAEISAYRQQRKALLARSRRFKSSQEQRLRTLQDTERKLLALLDRLEDPPAPGAPHGDGARFAQLKGKLDWPVRGKMVQRFGEMKKNGKLKATGVRLSSTTGAAVRAVSAGKVVYADWFRRLGLLLILDHGDGFMSLYGHNQVLLRKIGDRVGRRELIAKVGDTGGQQEPGLYFEIRRAGSPLNPSLWCKAASR